MFAGKRAVALGAAMMVCGAAGAQALSAPCRATAAAAPLPAVGAIDVAILLAPAPTTFAMTSCRFDLRSLARVRRPARLEPAVSHFPFDLDTEHLSRSPAHGTVESFDTIVSYTPEPGFAGVDTFTIDLAGVKAGLLGPTRVNFIVSRDGPPAGAGFVLR